MQPQQKKDSWEQLQLKLFVSMSSQQNFVAGAWEGNQPQVRSQKCQERMILIKVKKLF